MGGLLRDSVLCRLCSSDTGVAGLAVFTETLTSNGGESVAFVTMVETLLKLRLVEHRFVNGSFFYEFINNGLCVFTAHTLV